MITTSLTWNITDLKRHSSDGFVYEIRYSVTGVSTETVGGASTTFQHTMNGGYMVPDHTRTGSEIPYANVTQDNVVSWVQNGFVGIVTVGVGSDAITTTGIELEKSVFPDHLMVLYLRPTPTSGTVTPW